MKLTFSEFTYVNPIAARELTKDALWQDYYRGVTSFSYNGVTGSFSGSVVELCISLRRIINLFLIDRQRVGSHNDFLTGCVVRLEVRIDGHLDVSIFEDDYDEGVIFLSVSIVEFSNAMMDLYLHLYNEYKVQNGRPPIIFGEDAIKNLYKAR